MQFTLNSDGEFEDLDIQIVHVVATLDWKYFYLLTSSFFINFFKFLEQLNVLKLVFYDN